MSKKLSFFAALMVLILGLFISVTTTSNTNSIAFAHGGNNDECEDAINIDSLSDTNGGSFGDDLIVYNAPSGQVVSGVCIKAGNAPFGDGHSNSLGNGTYDEAGSPCYTISGVGTSSVTVTRVGTGNACQELSHIDVYLRNPVSSPITPTEPVSSPITPTDDPTPTVTLTPTPTDTQNQTPTNTPTPTPEEECDSNTCIHIDCPGGGTCEVNTGNTPTPTVTEAPTATPTNQPQVAGISASSSESKSESKSVLGANTMASTGGFVNNVMNTSFILGMMVLALGAISYGKEKKKA